MSRRQIDFTGISGRKVALQKLNSFTESGRIEHYKKDRDFPAIDGTSRLSHHIAVGEISIREVYGLAARFDSSGSETFIKELAWRDFYHQIYANFPQTKNQEFIKKYQNLDWRYDKKDFEKWKHGQTGFPIIDAAMRQLKQTGWMHNRLRMIVASFLVKDLLIDWRWGEEYFAKSLIDYDAASNLGGWQWAASVGTDAQPYFRIFNPALQSKKFDKNGDFIREFLPELAKVPAKYIHQPSQIPPEIMKAIQFKLDKDYPSEMVDHSVQRQLALAMFKSRV